MIPIRDTIPSCSVPVAVWILMAVSVAVLATPNGPTLAQLVAGLLLIEFFLAAPRNRRTPFVHVDDAACEDAACEDAAR